MKKYGKLIGAVAAFAVLMIAARLLYGELAQRHEPEKSLQVTEEAKADSEQAEENTTKAPDFSMTDRSGQPRNLQSFVGKPIVLNFWASWCGPCKMELPDFQAAYEEYDGEVEFLMVNMADGMRETKEKALEFMESEGYTLPVYFDSLQSGAYAYSVYSLPTIYFIDKEGNIVAGAEGMLDAASLEKGISMILQENTKEQ